MIPEPAPPGVTGSRYRDSDIGNSPSLGGMAADEILQGGEIVHFKYVKRADVRRYLDAGWIVCQVLRPCHHDDYAVIMEWSKPEPMPDMEAGRPGSNVEGAGDDRPSDGRSAA